MLKLHCIHKGCGCQILEPQGGQTTDAVIKAVEKQRHGGVLRDCVAVQHLVWLKIPRTRTQQSRYRAGYTPGADGQEKKIEDKHDFITDIMKVVKVSTAHKKTTKRKTSVYARRSRLRTNEDRDELFADLVKAVKNQARSQEKNQK